MRALFYFYLTQRHSVTTSLTHDSTSPNAYHAQRINVPIIQGTKIEINIQLEQTNKQTQNYNNLVNKCKKQPMQLFSHVCAQKHPER